MKNIKKFGELNEAEMRDNEGIPNASDRMRDYHGKAEREVQDAARDGKISQNLFRLVGEVESIESQNSDAITKLAFDMVRSEYGDLVEMADLDMKLSKLGDVPDDMKEDDDEFEVKGSPEEQEDMGEEGEGRKLDKTELKNEVDKRKIANLITQGESKNALDMFNMFKDRIDEINPSLFDNYVKIFKTNDAMMLSMAESPNMGDMMAANDGGIGGMVSVKWNEEGDENSQESAEDIMAKLESGQEIEDTQEEVEDLFREGKPSIKVRAVCLPLLIHEFIKGIYELITSRGIPEDQEMAQAVIDQTDTYQDELQDLKYGKYLKADFQEFLMENPKYNSVEQMKEFVFGEMMDLPAPQFISLFRGIMDKTPDAKRKVDEIMDKIIGEFDEQISDTDSDVDSMISKSNDEVEQEAVPVENGEDFSNMSQSELRSLVDDALDSGDFEKIEKISPFLKESVRNKVDKRVKLLKENLNRKVKRNKK